MVKNQLPKSLRALMVLVVAAAMAKHGVANGQRVLTPEFSARVIHVNDGDTLVALRANGQKIKVRLANIDAPETDHGRCRPGQPFSEKSSQALKRLVHGKTTEFVCSTLDQYDRHICDVVLNNTTANRELVRQGLAWANRARPSYLRDSGVVDAEREAQVARRGLWTDPASIAPWQWRREEWRKAC
jgi:endonuclease YncB( thermonuclease family)